MPTATWTPVKRFRSKSNPNKTHQVSQREDGILGCTCPSFTISAKNRGVPIEQRMCLHVEEVLESRAKGRIS